MATASAAFRLAVAATALALGPCRAEAQLRIAPSEGRFWAGAGVLLGAAFLLDERLSSAAAGDARTSAGRVVNVLEPLGRESVDVPLLAGALVASWASGGQRPAAAVLRVAAGYLVSDVLMSTLKPVVGRHRPDTLGGGAWRFGPFRGAAEWHSMPSGHVTHAFSLAAGVADEVPVPAIRAAAYATAALVGWQRVAFRGHWPSDVVAAAVLGIAASRTTNRWLRGTVPSGGSRPRVRLVVLPGAVFVAAPLP